jgi:O-antigen/teichoic acid export membrane protein
MLYSKIFNSAKRKQMAVTLVFRIINMVVAFAYAIIVARALMVSEYGSLSLINVLIMFLVYICGLQLHTFISARIPGKSEKKSLIYLKSLWVFEIVAVIVIGIICYFLKQFNLIKELEYFWYIFFILLLQLIGMDMMRYFFARKKILLANILKTLLEAIPRIIIISFFVVGIGINILKILIVLIIFKFFAVITGFLFLNPLLFLKTSFKIPLIKYGILFSFPMLVTAVMQYLTNFGDRWIIKYFWSNYEVGIYSFAYNLSFKLFGVTGGIVTAVLYPYMAEAYNRSDEKKFRQSRRHMMYIGTGFYFFGSLILLGLFPLLVKIVGKDAYFQGYFALGFLILGMFFFIAAYPFRYSLVLKKQTVAVMRYTFIGAIINLGLNFVLIPRFGFTAAAISFFIASIISFCLFYFKSRNCDIQ